METSTGTVCMVNVIESQAFITFLAFSITWLSTQNKSSIQILHQKETTIKKKKKIQTAN